MAGYDYRTNSEAADTLSFYIFDNLNAQQDGEGGNVYRFDTLQEAWSQFRAIEDEHPDWMIALGGSVDGMHEIDFVQRKDGENVLIEDWWRLDFWGDRDDVAQVIEELESAIEEDDERRNLQRREQAFANLPDTGKPFLDYETPYDTEKVNIEIATYEENDNIFVGLSYFDPELGFMDYYSDLSVNILKLPPFMAALDTNNNNQEKLLNFLTENGLGELTGGALPSGFCMYPVFRFNEERLAELDPKGFKQHCIDAGIDLKPKSLESLKEQAKERAAEKNADRAAKRLTRSQDLEK